MKKIDIKHDYIGSNWNEYFVENFTKQMPNGDEVRLRFYRDGAFRWYTFGIMSKNPNNRPGHGGEWSSNAKFINEVFGIKLVDGVLNSYTCAFIKIDVENGFIQCFDSTRIKELKERIKNNGKACHIKPQ
jgi:hypothetical protein